MRFKAILLLILMILLTSCTVGNRQGVSTSDNTSESVEITSADPSDNTSADETVHPTLNKTAISKEDILIGMTSEEYSQLIGDENDFEGWMGYNFLFDKDGNALVVKLDGNPYAVKEVRSYPKRDSLPTHADFEKITEGMTIYEVVEHVGIPRGASTYGLISYSFLTEDGSRYNIFFEGDMTVSSVELYRG